MSLGRKSREKTMRVVALNLALGLLLALGACSGDGRLLEEAVEVHELDLDELKIVQPKGLLPDLYLNPGEQIRFSVEAQDSLGGEIDVSLSNRRWSVDKTNLASIDSDGNFTAKADGLVSVKLQVGAVESPAFDVNILDSNLTSITEITGPETLEPCIFGSYSAMGTFTSKTDDTTQSTRGLLNVEWTSETLSLGSEIDGTVSVIGTNAGMGNELFAALGDVKSEAKAIEVTGNLTEILITPGTLAVAEGKTQQLGANGQYTRGDNEEFETITNAVQWSVPSNNGIATVSNSVPSKGLVSGNSKGNILVTAKCGDFKGTKTLVVTDEGTGSSSGLAFEGDNGNGLTISLAEGNRQLKVSTGSEFDPGNDKTEESATIWTVLSGSDVVSFQSPQNGLITLLTTGLAKIQAEYKGTKASLSINVIP